MYKKKLINKNKLNLHSHTNANRKRTFTLQINRKEYSKQFVDITISIYL